MILKRTLYFAFSIFFVFCISAPQVRASEQKAITRAAFDLGSGKFKMVVADVYGRQVNVKFSKMIDIKLAEDFASSPNGVLSKKIQKEALRALQELKQDAENYGAQQFCGITTAVFRKAKNGEKLFEQLRKEAGVDLQLVSQEKEGAFGFNTALVLSPELSEENIISWDSGNASFQITAKEADGYIVYEGPLGNGLIAKAFSEEVRGIPYSKDVLFNPISLAECEELAEVIKQKISLPQWLERKLLCQATAIVAIGDKDSIFAMAAKALGRNEYSIQDVQEVIERLVGLSSEELSKLRSAPETVIVRLVLLHTVMEKFGIQTVTFKESTGITLGLLIDPDLWN